MVPVPDLSGIGRALLFILGILAVVFGLGFLAGRWW